MLGCFKVFTLILIKSQPALTDGLAWEAPRRGVTALKDKAQAISQGIEI